MNCIHQETGLCPNCQVDQDADPQAWLEFGQHTQGIENWKKLQEEMDKHREEILTDDGTVVELPF